MQLTLGNGHLMASTHNLAVHQQKGFVLYKKIDTFFIKLFQSLFGCYKNVAFDEGSISNHHFSLLNDTERKMIENAPETNRKQILFNTFRRILPTS
ncbi:hypothetical protein K0U07_01995 [bacterium]|nr:hypothetical protein [bacterium]